MQAASTSQHLRHRIEAALVRGDAAYGLFSRDRSDLKSLVQAAAAYGAAFELADTAAGLVPTRDYARVSQFRSTAQQRMRAVHELVADLGVTA